MSAQPGPTAAPEAVGQVEPLFVNCAGCHALLTSPRTPQPGRRKVAGYERVLLDTGGTHDRPLCGRCKKRLRR
jgi:hypothetical protein